MRLSRLAPLFIVLLIAAALGSWYVFRSHGTPAPEYLTVYYTKVDGTTLGTWNVSMRALGPGESAQEHLRNVALYGAVQAIAGPPSDVEAIRFPSGTHVIDLHVTGTTANVDLSDDVARQSGGSFGENGEFKSLVYTITGVPGIDAVAITVAGRKVDTLPGGHLELDQPLHRSDW